MNFKAQLSLGAAEGPSMGETRARLLAAIGREGSISAAARAVGMSYKAAWDAVDAMNNLFGRPLVTAQTGGRKGGGAALTPDGALAVEAYRRLDAALADAMQSVAPLLTAAGMTGLGAPDNWARPTLVRTSARNALRAVVASAHVTGVGAVVALRIGAETMLSASITRDSLIELGLVPGRPCLALIKAPFVVFTPDDAGSCAGSCAGSAPAHFNRISGVTARRESDAEMTEIILDIGGGKTLTGTLPTARADALGLTPGAAATATVDPAHVIIAAA